MVYCTSSTRTTTTNNDDDTAKTIQSIDGNSGVVKLESIDSIDPPLSQKLLKLTILLDQWPYQMPCMLFLVVENLQQQELESEIRTRTCTGKQSRRSSIEIGESVPVSSLSCKDIPSARRLNSKNNKRG